jgi:hypothetical protein
MICKCAAKRSCEQLAETDDLFVLARVLGSFGLNRSRGHEVTELFRASDNQPLPLPLFPFPVPLPLSPLLPWPLLFPLLP